MNKATSDALRAGYIDIDLKTKILRLEQYGRKENLVISGIADDMSDSEAESKFLDSVKLVGIEIPPSEVVAFHKIKKDNNRIARFKNRRSVESILRKGRDLEAADKRNIWGNNIDLKVFPNLSPEYLKLRYFCKKLKQDGYIVAFGFNGIGVWAKQSEDSNRTQIDCNDDAAKFLPEGMTCVEFLLRHQRPS